LSSQEVCRFYGTLTFIAVVGWTRHRNVSLFLWIKFTQHCFACFNVILLSASR